MRGPELHTLLVTRPDPLPPNVGRPPARGLAEGESATAEPPSHDDAASPRTDPRESVSSRRQFASGGYQVHNGRPAAPVVIG